MSRELSVEYLEDQIKRMKETLNDHWGEYSNAEVEHYEKQIEVFRLALRAKAAEQRAGEAKLEILKWACEEIQNEMHGDYASDLWKKEKGQALFEAISSKFPNSTPALGEGEKLDEN